MNQTFGKVVSLGCINKVADKMNGIPYILYIIKTDDLTDKKR